LIIIDKNGKAAQLFLLIGRNKQNNKIKPKIQVNANSNLQTEYTRFSIYSTPAFEATFRFYFVFWR